VPAHLVKRFQECAAKGELTYISTALEWSRPFWKIKHRKIKLAAAVVRLIDDGTRHIAI
jgi:hypothetical protein